MTKSTVAGANNPIMVEDIFDVFTRQADQMGSYNAFCGAVVGFEQGVQL